MHVMFIGLQTII